VKQVSKVGRSRQAAREVCITTLEQMISGKIEVYAGYRRLYTEWCTRNSAVPELRPMFRVPSVSADDTFSVTEEFENQILSLAREILLSFHLPTRIR
jgi:hypothetical protein